MSFFNAVESQDLLNKSNFEKAIHTACFVPKFHDDFVMKTSPAFGGRLNIEDPKNFEQKEVKSEEKHS